MKPQYDMLGNELNINDFIVSSHDHGYIFVAKIVRFTTGAMGDCYLECDSGGDSKTYYDHASPSDCVLIHKDHLTNLLLEQFEK